MATWTNNDVNTHGTVYKLISDVNEMELATVEPTKDGWNLKVLGLYIPAYRYTKGINSEFDSLNEARACGNIAARTALVDYCSRLIDDLDRVNYGGNGGRK